MTTESAMTDRTRRNILTTGAAAAATAGTSRLLAQQKREGAAMSIYEKGPVRIHFEEKGSGFPLLMIAGGGLNSAIPNLSAPYSPFNATDEFKEEYRCIGADLRNANGGQSTGPLEIDRPWGSHTDDHLGLMDHLRIDKFHGAGILHRRSHDLESVEAGARPDRCCRAGAALGLAARDARPVLRQQHEGLGAGACEAKARYHDGAGGKIPDQDVSHQPRLRIHGDARFRPQLPDAGADPARRHPGASLCGCDGGRDAGAERRGEHVPVEGAEGAGSARGAADPLLPPRTPARGGVKASLRAKIGRVGRD